MVSSLNARLERLESAGAHRGPLLVSWQLDADKRAVCTYAGIRRVQEPGEERQAFFARVRAVVPAAAVVWVSQLDEAL